MSNKLAHLQMIQGIIDRLAQASARLKGWTVVLVAAMFALAAAKSKPGFILLAYFPAVAFWVLDGFYLWQEKLFRALYDHVRGLAEDQVDFAMDTSVVKDHVKAWGDVTLSTTLLIFHLTVIISIVIVMVIARFT